MIIDLYYSTVGLMLDIMIVTIPILFHFGANKNARLKIYFIIYFALLFILGFLNDEPILNYLVMFSIIATSLYFIIKVDFRKLFLYVLYFTFIFMFDYSYTFMGPIVFLIYTTIYKLILLKIIKKFYFESDEKLKEKILSGASVSVIIILAIIIGGIYV